MVEKRKRSRRDADIDKGSIEDAASRDATPTSLSGQLPHRPENELIEGSDTDFPEPGENPEHSGQKIKRRKR
jgi:hypothetical protein